LGFAFAQGSLERDRSSKFKAESSKKNPNAFLSPAALERAEGTEKGDFLFHCGPLNRNENQAQPATF
jgi:hypothetical protein